MGRLAGKVCVVTGTGGSIGRAAALRFASEGGLIVGCDVAVDRAMETQEAVRSTGGTMESLHPCDLTRLEDCIALRDLALARFGRVDVVYNNAAMAYLGAIDELSVDDWNRTLNEEVNLVFLLVRTLWPDLVETSGTIVNTASVSAWQAYRGMAGIAHMAAKGAILSMTRQLAMEGAPHGIRANSLSPGFIATLQTQPVIANPEWHESMKAMVMLGRAGRPQEVAEVALFLACDESSFVTGADIRVDGGTTSW